MLEYDLCFGYDASWLRIPDKPPTLLKQQRMMSQELLSEPDVV